MREVNLNPGGYLIGSAGFRRRYAGLKNVKRK